VRTFSIAALLGALAQGIALPGLVPAGALVVGGLAALSYARSRSTDPGLTTELALLATYLVGVLAMHTPLLGAGCGTLLAVLLAARTQLHRFATHWLREQEMHDGLMLAALALVILPLVPDEPLAWLAGMRPRPLASLVLLILLLQAAGHVALRLFGARLGLAASGFFGGFVSSTATVAAFGARARAGQVAVPLAASAGALSGCATWVQMMVMAAAISPAALALLWWPALAGLAATLAVAALWSVRGAGDGSPVPLVERSALRLREALAVAVLLAGVALLVSQAQQWFGNAGALAGAAIAALADAHSPIASLLSLFDARRLDAPTFVQGVWIALAANTVTRLVTAFVSGGASYALRVGPALLAGLAASALAGTLAA
jgi:uncharacterized membrane protein (DUF4010 family)